MLKAIMDRILISSAMIIFALVAIIDPERVIKDVKELDYK